MTFLAFLGVTEILCSFRLVLEERTGKEIPKSKFPTNSFALWDIVAGHVTSRKTVYPKNLSCGPGLSISIFVYTRKLSCLNISVFRYVRKPHFLNSSIVWYIKTFLFRYQYLAYIRKTSRLNINIFVYIRKLCSLNNSIFRYIIIFEYIRKL